MQIFQIEFIGDFPWFRSQSNQIRSFCRLDIKFESMTKCARYVGWPCVMFAPRFVISLICICHLSEWKVNCVFALGSA